MARKRESEEVRRQQILEAAFEVATREGLPRLTVRAVAAEAGLSHALVLYHFESRELLLIDLLDWLLANTSVLRVSEDIARFPRVLDRLHALLQQEMARLSHEPQHTMLFFEFWALGARHETVRLRISAELERYRAAFRDIMEDLLAAEPATFGAVTADGMAAVAVSWIHGCAVQAMVDPSQFDTDDYLSAVRGIVGQLA